MALRALCMVTIFTGVQCEEAEFDPYSDGIGDDSLTADQLRALHGKFDTNSDGKVSLQEMIAFSESVAKKTASKDTGAVLEEIDTSKDGFLSLEEHLNDLKNQADGDMNNDRKALETTKFNAADLNGDGKLEKDELPALFYPETNEVVLSITVGQTLRQKDKNDDQKLSAIEFWVGDGYESNIVDIKFSDEEKSDFARLDSNGDGFIDAQELQAWESGRFHTEDAMKKLVDVADKNGDMHITGEELVAARDKLAGSDAQYHLIEWAEVHEL